MEFNIVALAEQIPTETAAYLLLEKLRWNGKPTCAHCGTDRVYYLNSTNPDGRKTTRGKVSERRVWKCRKCRKQFSVLTGTIFYGTHISIRKWVFVVFEMCANKNGLAAREVERKYKLSPKSAWFMTQRIREAMKSDPLAGLLQGTIVVDETYVGGDPKNRHGHDKRTAYERKHLRGRATDKTTVVSLVHKESGVVRSRVVPNVDGRNLRDAIERHVDLPGSTLHTDEFTTYKSIGADFKSHGVVKHRDGEYSRNGVSTNVVEGYFSQLKRSLDGTHHHISETHLHRYLAEFDYRYSSRKSNDTERMERLMGQVERRLAYKQVV